jgi:electron transfer flavoprotein alpha subunit
MVALLLADTRDGRLLESTAQALNCAKEICPIVHILVIGNSEHATAEARKLGAEKVIVAIDLSETSADESLADLITDLSDQYDVIIGSASSVSKSVLPRVAAKLDVMQISEITRVVGKRVFERPIYAGNAIQTVEATDAKLVITVRTSAFPGLSSTSADSLTEELSWRPADTVSHFKEDIRSTSTRPDLASAKIIVSGGRGLQSAESFSQIVGSLADALGAAVGASRAAVDSGYAPNDLQVGQTGKVVAPELYIAIGISGAIQHLAGMKDSKVIVAINKDPEAPIFQVADFGFVGDLFLAAPELKEELAR